jgi:hypothetical protein
MSYNDKIFQDSAVCTGTSYGLDDREIVDRFLGGGRGRRKREEEEGGGRVYSLPRLHQASYSMGSRDSFSRDKAGTA